MPSDDERTLDAAKLRTITAAKLAVTAISVADTTRQRASNAAEAAERFANTPHALALRRESAEAQQAWDAALQAQRQTQAQYEAAWHQHEAHRLKQQGQGGAVVGVASAAVCAGGECGMVADGGGSATAEAERGRLAAEAGMLVAEKGRVAVERQLEVKLEAATTAQHAPVGGLSLLDDDALRLLLTTVGLVDLFVLSVTSRRLHTAIMAASFRADRIRIGDAAIVVDINAPDPNDDDDDDDEWDGFSGTPGEYKCTEFFRGSFFVGTAKAGSFRCILIDRVSCYRQGLFLMACDAEAQDLFDIGSCLFDRQGLPCYAPLGLPLTGEGDEDLFDRLHGGFLYISHFKLKRASEAVYGKAKEAVSTAMLRHVASLAIRKILLYYAFEPAWGVAAYIGDGEQRTYPISPHDGERGEGAAGDGFGRADEFRRRKTEDCRPFVHASFEEIDTNRSVSTQQGGCLFTTKARLYDSLRRRMQVPLRAEPEPEAAASGGQHKWQR